MFTEQERQRFRTLQTSQQKDALTEAERAELEQLAQRVENEEAIYLIPATERILLERRRIEAQNAALQALLQRQERLARRLERVLELSQAERQAIKTELTHILETSGAGAG